MSRTFINIHGQYGSPIVAEHYKPLSLGCEVIGFDYKAQTPCEVECEFAEYFVGLGCTSEGIDKIWKASGYNSRTSVFRVLNRNGVQFNRGLHLRPIKNQKFSAALSNPSSGIKNSIGLDPLLAEG